MKKMVIFQFPQFWWTFIPEANWTRLRIWFPGSAPRGAVEVTNGLAMGKLAQIWIWMWMLNPQTWIFEWKNRLGDWDVHMDAIRGLDFCSQTIGDWMRIFKSLQGNHCSGEPRGQLLTKKKPKVQSEGWISHDATGCWKSPWQPDCSLHSGSRPPTLAHWSAQEQLRELIWGPGHFPVHQHVISHCKARTLTSMIVICSGWPFLLNLRFASLKLMCFPCRDFLGGLHVLLPCSGRLPHVLVRSPSDMDIKKFPTLKVGLSRGPGSGFQIKYLSPLSSFKWPENWAVCAVYSRSSVLRYIRQSTLS